MKFPQQATYSVLTFTTLLAFATSFSIFGRDSEIGLLSYMARSNDLLLQDPSRSLSCFNKYIPLINEIAQNYETSFKACLNESEAASAKADEDTLEQRNNLANAAEESCASLKKCQEDSSVEGIFQCYIDGGSASIQSMYMINSNASQELADLREQYYLIKNNEYKCTNETKRSYERESAEAYAGLNNCILGNDNQESTANPSNTIQTTTNAPTAATEETTPAEPQTSTIIPETTEEVSEETTSEKPEESSALPESTTNQITEATEDTTPAESETTDSPIISTIGPETTNEEPVESTSENPQESSGSTASETNDTTESASEN